MLAGSEGDHRPHVSRIPHPPPRRPRTAIELSNACVPPHAGSSRPLSRATGIVIGLAAHFYRATTPPLAPASPNRGPAPAGLGDLRRALLLAPPPPLRRVQPPGRGILLALGGPFSGTVSGTVGSPAPGQDGWVVSLHLLRRQPRADAHDRRRFRPSRPDRPCTRSPRPRPPTRRRPLPSRTTPPTPSLGFSHWRVWAPPCAGRPSGRQGSRWARAMLRRRDRAL